MSYLQAPNVVRQPGPPPVENDPPQDTIADLIQRAVSSEVPRLVKAADRIGDLVDQLEKDVAEHERSRELRAEAERLEQRLAQIRQQLGHKPAGPGRPAGEVSPKAVRAWAAANGVDCPKLGRVPGSVMAAYAAQVPGGAA